MEINLAYRIKRLFRGESGIVESVSVSLKDSTLPDFIFDKRWHYGPDKDDYKTTPQKVSFRNPLGELVTMPAPLTFEKVARFDKSEPREFVRVYKRYLAGDRFP